MRRLSLAVSLVALAVLPACAAEPAAVDEEVESSDAALAADWGEIDEDATPLTAAERDEAFGDDADEGEAIAGEFLETNGAGVDDLEPLEAAATASAPLISAPPPLPKSCDPTSSLSLVVYSEGYSHPILKALGDRATPCSRYTISVPKVAGSPSYPDNALFPRRILGKGVRAYGDGFVASAEVHWGGARAAGRFYPGWKNVKVVKTGPAQYKTVVVEKSEYYANDWYLKGVLFRQRMAKRGFRPHAGDTWHINELESVWARTRVQQKAIRDLVRGLADGDREYDAATDTDPEIAKLDATQKAEITKAARMKDVRGVIFVSALGKRRPGETSDAPHEAALKQTLRRSRFWADMASYVKSFAVERYLSFAGNCVKGRSLAGQSNAMDPHIMELEETAQRAPHYKTGKRAGQSTVGTALSYLSRAYQPVITAAWGFNNDGLSLAQMRSFVAGQVFATRAYANTHRTPDNRIGIYFKAKKVTTPEVTAAFADRVALALNGAYDGKDGRAIGACGPTGADGCTCGD